VNYPPPGRPREQSPPGRPVPFLSIVIGVFNDWEPLDQCLRSLSGQIHVPDFEVIVIDDGSRESAPEFIRRSIPIPVLTIVRQSHAGISVARNTGIEISRGSVLVFVDADCRLRSDCLANLGAAIADFPQRNCFQLHLVGECSQIVGRSEQLRLITLQTQLLRSDGCIRYLNTAGFAIRRERIRTGEKLFDPAATRGEDTLLLANLMEEGELPVFLPNAIVEHVVGLSVMGSLWKSVWTAYQEAGTYGVINSKGVSVRVSPQERLNMLRSMWKTSGQPGIGRMAWLVLVARQALKRIASFVFGGLRVRGKFEAANRRS
jgi:glycosyltransferase involved in cell wall biosynthesis